MSITMILEIEEKIDKAVLVNCLKQVGVSFQSNGDLCVCGNFIRSNMHYVMEKKDGVLEAEGGDGQDWRVGWRIIFHYVTAFFDQCSDELHQFLRLLEEKTLGRFILSFQFEYLCAYRDENGFKEVERF